MGWKCSPSYLMENIINKHRAAQYQQTEGCTMGWKCSPSYLMENIINKHRAAQYQQTQG